MASNQSGSKTNGADQLYRGGGFPSSILGLSKVGVSNRVTPAEDLAVNRACQMSPVWVWYVKVVQLHHPVPSDQNVILPLSCWQSPAWSSPQTNTLAVRSVCASMWAVPVLLGLAASVIALTSLPRRRNSKSTPKTRKRKRNCWHRKKRFLRARRGQLSPLATLLPM